MTKVLVTGSAGFIGGYVVEELLRRNYEVVGLDNFSKYGKVAQVLRRPPQLPARRGRRPRHRPRRQAARRRRALHRRRRAHRRHLLLPRLPLRPAGGNERIIAASCDAAIRAHTEGSLQKMTYLELVDGVRVHHDVAVQGGRRARVPAAAVAPTASRSWPCEYFARAAWDQYGLPYTILRPFNCVGIGESRALGDVEVLSGNVKLAMSHVVPDLVQKVLKGQDPLHILGEGNQVRHYTYGADLARGHRHRHGAPRRPRTTTSTSRPRSRRPCSSSPRSSGARSRAPDVPFRYESDAAFEYDVQKRVPDVSKARERARLRGDDDPGRDARRGHPVDPAGGRGGQDLVSGTVAVRPVAGDAADRASARRRWRDCGPLGLRSRPRGRGRHSSPFRCTSPTGTAAYRRPTTGPTSSPACTSIAPATSPAGLGTDVPAGPARHRHSRSSGSWGTPVHVRGLRRRRDGVVVRLRVRARPPLRGPVGPSCWLSQWPCGPGWACSPPRS